MDRGEQSERPTLQVYPQQQEGYLPQQQQQTPQAALAAVTRGDNGPQGRTETDTTQRPATGSTEKYGFDDGTTSGGDSSPRREKSDPYGRATGITIAPPAPLRARSLRDDTPYRPIENIVSPSRRRGSGLDWVVPVAEGGEKPYVPRVRTIGERLEPTLVNAQIERDKFAKKAMWNGYILNMAIGLQVILGALVTGLSSAIKPSKVGVTTSALGGLSTLCASYLARMRGSNEPSLSITRVKDLDQFIRECKAFQMDRGHVTNGEAENMKLDMLRKRFEELLGNLSGERKLTPPV